MVREVQSVRLGTYTLDRSKTMVAGISAGGYMATQLQVAYSKTFHGAAIFAGGPYYCAQDNAYIALNDCTKNYYSTNVPLLETDTDNTAYYGYIDPTSYLSGQKAWLFSGTNDTTVYQSVVRDLQTYLTHYGVTVTTNFTTAAGHGWITPDATAACGATASPFLNNCGFDAEQTFLTTLYGTLAARNGGTLGGTLQTFNQNEFLPGGSAAAYSMDANGYVFVPSACASGSTCKVLVALHGCAQGYQQVGNAFVTKSGINEWADTNNIIVLYPQAIETGYNPNGCWDWYGYNSTDYAAKSGPQMAAIYAMVQRL
ncbi:MAG: poly (3-hydroxybutyrate) depolymerase [Candidatus Eremiobacteraeota bacterium]|nr:poly (3-hydroxybutyrate) depolymerase [Candidatus Eremiobacteraeota bacterium]